jgi:hypothetical protein
MSHHEDILRYLKEKYDVVPVIPSHLISKFGLSIPLQGREDLLDVTKDLYDERWRNRGTRDRNSHKIGLVGGCSGIGKSRALIEIARSIPQWKGSQQWSFEIVISYNNGNPPEIDRRLFSPDSDRRSAPTALALRILYFSFVAGKTGNAFFKSFEDFVHSFPQDLMEMITPQIAIKAITLHLREVHGHADGVIYIGLDELNYLLDSDCDGEAKQRRFLKETIIALGGAMLMPDEFVFTIIAGTTVLPIDIVSQQLGLQIQLLPINLLNSDQCDTIVDRMIPTLSNGWQKWRTCRAFRTFLSDFASMPRKAAQLIEYVNEFVNRGTALIDIDYDSLYNKLMASLAPPEILLIIADEIVSDILLLTPIRRNQIVNTAKSNCTYGLLEELGVIAIETSRDSHLIVQMPYSHFRSLLQCMNGGDPLHKSLRTICNIVRAGDFLNWQNFEILHCNMEASREMVMARRRNEGSRTSLGEFYCVPVDNDFDFLLRRECTVVTARSRFPSTDWHIHGANVQDGEDKISFDIATESYVKNADGAVFDGFTIRDIDEENGNKILFCGQQKAYLVATVSAELIEEEIIKVRASIPEGQRFQLVVIANKINTDICKHLPEECIVVTGLALEKFYSIFSARAKLVFGCQTQININIASEFELRTINRIGKRLAESIVNSRKKEFFRSWDEVLSRIGKIPRSAEEIFSY